MGRYLQFISSPDEIARAYHSSYDPLLVVVSVSIAIFAAFVAFKLADRMGAAPGAGQRHVWHGLGALALGIGTWAMHFIGMLAFKLDCGVFYDPFITFFSMIPGVAAAAVALQVISQQGVPRGRLLLGGVVMGGGIGAMHYTGMAAMRLNAILRYDPALFALSIGVAVVLALAALSIRATLGRTPLARRPLLVPALSALVMGCAISGMHYTAMEAAYFIPDGGESLLVSSNPALLAWGVSLATLLIIVLALVSALASRRLQLSEGRYNLIFQVMGQGFVRLDQGGVILEANPAFAAMAGGSPGEVEGGPFADLLAGVAARERVEGVLATGVKAEFDANLITREGGLLPCAIHLELRRMAVNEPPICIALVTRQERVRAVLAALGEGVCGLDRQGLVELANPAAARLLGRGEADLLGTELLARFRQPGGEGLAGGADGPLSRAREAPVRFPELWLAVDGEREVPVSLTLTPLAGEGGWGGFVAVFADITRQRRAEAQRQEHERHLALLNQQLQLLLTHSRDIVYRRDREGRFTYLSPALETITGYSPDQWLERQEELLARYPLNREGYEWVRRAVSSGSAQPPYLLELPHRGAGTVQLETHEQPYAEGTGGAGVIGVARDVTERLRLERQMRQLQRAVEQSPASVVITDPDGSIEYVNPRFVEVTGYSAAEAVGQNPRVLKSGLHEPEFYRALWSTISRGEVWRGELANRKKNGELYWEAASISPVRDGEGRITHYVAVKEDITARKVAEEAIVRLSRQNELILQAAGDGIYGVDREGRATFFNSAAQRMTGWSPEEVIGRRPHPLFHHTRSDGGSYPPEECPVLRTARDGVTRQVEGELFWCRDGSRFPVEYTVTSIQGEAGGRGAVVVFRDITQRLEAERALKESEERLQIALSASNTGYWDWNPLKDEAYFSDQWLAMLGYRREEVTPDASGLRGLIHPDDLERVGAILRQHLAGERADYQVEFRMRHKDGTWKWILTSGRIIERDQAGRVIRMSGIHKDISELKGVEEQLKRAMREAESANRAKTEFLATMSHEIRTPMNVVIGMGDVLLGSPLTPEQRGHVELLQHSGVALLELINDILDLSKIEAGRLELSRGVLDPRELVARTIQMLELRAHEKGLELLFNPREPLPPAVYGDAARLRQVLVNLVGNAIKFTERGRIQVFLATDPERGELHCTVADTGVGIAVDHLDLVFDKFTQADSTVVRKYGGTGLGLAISKRLVELMGGRIWVESRVGEGSTFHFTIPLLVADRHLLPSSGEGRETAPPTVPVPALNLLLVDDSEDNILLLRTYLRQTPHRVTVAGDGQEAVALATTEPFDLILMDMQMPVMDGYSATRAIRRWERERGRSPMGIYALTAHALDEDRGKCLEAGCDHYLTKPIKKGRLLAEIANFAVGRSTEVADSVG